MFSDQWGFLAKMGEDTGDHRFGPGFAVPDFPVQPVNPAFSWTKRALLKHLVKELNSLVQLSSFMKTDVGGYECHFSTILAKNLLYS